MTRCRSASLHSASLLQQHRESRTTLMLSIPLHIVYRQLQRDSGFGRFFLCSLVTNELDFSIISLGENFGQVWISVSVTRRQLHAVARDDDSHDRALRLGASSRRRSTGLSQAHVRASRPCRERMRCVPSHVILSLLLPPLPPMRPNMALGRASCPPAIPPGRRSLRGEASQHRRRRRRQQHPPPSPPGAAASPCHHGRTSSIACA